MFCTIPRATRRHTSRSYVLRRAFFVATLIPADQTWSSRRAENVCKWDAHLLRDWCRQSLHYTTGCNTAWLPTSWSWASVPRKYHDMAWLQSQRVSSDDFSKGLSTLGTRIIHGGVSARWEAGVGQASALIQIRGLEP